MKYEGNNKLGLNKFSGNGLKTILVIDFGKKYSGIPEIFRVILGDFPKNLIIVNLDFVDNTGF